jgi:hypothetical protein
MRIPPAMTLFTPFPPPADLDLLVGSTHAGGGAVMRTGENPQHWISKIGASLSALLGRLFIVGLVAVALVVLASAFAAPAAQFLVSIRSAQALATTCKRVSGGAASSATRRRNTPLRWSTTRA